MANPDTSRLRALLDLSRCDWCGWPLDPKGEMCRADNCSMRPRPKRNDTDLRQEVRALLTAAERAKGLEEENARLRAALRGLLDTGWHRDYGYGDPACDVPYGGECSCGLTNAKNAARAALEAGK